jgi:iron(III) transport system permease protein
LQPIRQPSEPSRDVAVALALLSLGARITQPARGRHNRLAGLGYAIPGAVIAIGVLVPVARIDRLIAEAGIATRRAHGKPRDADLRLVRFLGVAYERSKRPLEDHPEHGGCGARSVGAEGAFARAPR